MKRLSQKDTINFTQAMSTLLQSSMNIQTALKVIMDSTQRRPVQAVSGTLLKEVQSGRMLYQGLSKTGVFSSFFIMMVRIGETTSDLCSVFERLCDYLKEKQERRNKSIQALLYPSLVLITVSIVLIILSFYVFPRLSEVFELLSPEKTSTETFTLMVRRIKTLAISVVCSVLFIVLFCISAQKSRTIKQVFDKTAYKIPFLKRTVRSRNISLFCFSMKSLLYSGLSAEDSLFLSEQAVQNSYFGEKLKEAVFKVQSGRSLSESLIDKDVFPTHFTSMLKLNENIGDIKKTFSDLETYYKAEDENLTDTLIKAIEPFFIVLTGLLVFMVVWRFVVPLYSMLGEIQI